MKRRKALTKKNFYTNDKTSNIFVADKRKSAIDIVIGAIKKLLVTKKIRPGDKLPSETVLAESMGVSRGSVREAMKILSAFGIVDIKRGNGTYIADSTKGILFDPLLFKLVVNNNEFRELRELREIIELGIVELAIRYADDEDLIKLEESYKYTLDKIRKGLYKEDVIIDCESMFHTALGQASKNVMVQTIYNFVMDIFIPNIYIKNSDIDFGYDATKSHKPIIDAIKNRDLDAGYIAIKNSLEIWNKNSHIQL